MSEQELHTHTQANIEQQLDGAPATAEAGAVSGTAPAGDSEGSAIGMDSINPEELVAEAPPAADAERTRLKAVIEAMIYVTEEPLSLQQIAAATARPIEDIKSILDELVSEYARPDRGLSIRELAEQIAGIAGFAGRLVFDPTRPDGTPRKLLDVTRLTELGWVARIPLAQGLEETYRWFRAQGGKVRTVES